MKYAVGYCRAVVPATALVERLFYTKRAVTQGTVERFGWPDSSSSSSSSIHSYVCSLVHSELRWWGLNSSMHLQVPHMHLQREISVITIEQTNLISRTQKEQRACSLTTAICCCCRCGSCLVSTVA
jgi:hypothetical protein